MQDHNRGRPRYRHLTERDQAAIERDVARTIAHRRERKLPAPTPDEMEALRWDARWLLGLPCLTSTEAETLRALTATEFDAVARLLFPGNAGLPTGIGYEDARRRKREHKRRSAVPRLQIRHLAIWHRIADHKATWQIETLVRRSAARSPAAKASLMLDSLREWGVWKGTRPPSAATVKRWHRAVRLEACDYLILRLHETKRPTTLL